MKGKPGRWLANFEAVLIVLIVLTIIGLLAYGGFRAKRWWNYKFGYSSNVNADIEAATQPLKQEIEALKKRVSALEAKEKWDRLQEGGGTGLAPVRSSRTMQGGQESGP